MDFEFIYRVLGKHPFGYPPETVGRMTLHQACMLLVDGGVDPRTGEGTIRFGTVEEYSQWKMRLKQ